MNDIKLLPCAHCGAEAEMQNAVIEAAIRCSECGITIKRYHSAMRDDGIPTVIEAWNMRVSGPTEKGH